MKKFIVALAALASALGINAAAETVSLPSFDVRINGIKIENRFREYPCVVYKDITYFPMTYFDGGFMGLNSSYTDKGGLVLNSTGSTGIYESYKSGTENNGTLTAEIASYPVTVNGVSIDNSKEEYPLLNLRGVTYFPLTYTYVHDMFGWETSFGETGLSVVNRGCCGTLYGTNTGAVSTEYTLTENTYDTMLLGSFVLRLSDRGFEVICPDGSDITLPREGSGYNCAYGAENLYINEYSGDYKLIKTYTVTPDGAWAASEDGTVYVEAVGVTVNSDGSLKINDKIAAPGVSYSLFWINEALSLATDSGSLIIGGRKEDAGLNSVFSVDISTGEAEEIISDLYEDKFTVYNGKVYAIVERGDDISLLEYSLADKTSSYVSTVSDESLEVWPTYSVNKGGIYYKNGGFFYGSGGYHEETDTDMLLYKVGSDTPVMGGIEPYEISAVGDYTIVYANGSSVSPITGLIIDQEGNPVFVCCSHDLLKMTVSGDKVYITQYVVDEYNVARPTLFEAGLIR